MRNTYLLKENLLMVGSGAIENANHFYTWRVVSFAYLWHFMQDEDKEYAIKKYRGKSLRRMNQKIAFIGLRVEGGLKNEDHPQTYSFYKDFITAND